MHLSSADWSTIQANLRGRVGDADFDSWLSTLQLRDATEQGVTLAVPTPYVQDWIDRHFGQVIADTIQDALQRPMHIRYVVQPALRPAPNAVALPMAAAMAADGIGDSIANGAADGGVVQAPAPAVSSGYASAADASTPTTNRLDPRYKFETYVEGKSNAFAYAAAQRIAEGYDANYNPFFLYGGVGLGKTHLMQAVGWRLQETKPNAKIMYLSAEQFFNHMVRALKSKEMLSFKDYFRSVDVLMIDDIQFIGGKGNFQEEFFHTFEALVSQGKQIILTADRSPHDLENMDDRLRSRLGSGLTCQIYPPELETRIAILQKKATDLRIKLPENVAFFLADGINSNVRELEGALNRLAAHVSFTGAALTLDLAQEQLRDLFRANTRLLTVEDIQRKVAEYYNIRLTDLHGARRLRSIARPRQVAMFLAKKLTSKSYPDIGRAFGGRDHTTVIHAVRTIENLTPREPGLKEDVILLEKMLTTR